MDEIYYMPEKELMEYVKNQLSKGYGAIDIIKVLAKSGYTKAEIDQTFKHVFENKKHSYPYCAMIRPLLFVSLVNWLIVNPHAINFLSRVNL